jgi:hypothetical protein
VVQRALTLPALPRQSEAGQGRAAGAECIAEHLDCLAHVYIDLSEYALCCRNFDVHSMIIDYAAPILSR